MNKIISIPKYVYIYPLVSMFLYIGIGIITPIQAIFYRDIGLSLLQIGIIATVLELSILFFEVPTGYIADKFGRNISVGCTFFCFVISGCIIFFFRNFSSIIIATFIQGIGYTCMSGAFEAWGVDMLKSRNDDEYIQNLIVLTTQTRRFGFIIGSLLGGWLGLKFINSVLCLYIINNLVCLIIIIIFMKDTYKCNNIEVDDKSIESDIEKKTILQKYFICKSQMLLKFLIILCTIGMIHEFALSPIEEYWTILFTEDFNVLTIYLSSIIIIINLIVIFFVKPITVFLSKKYGDLSSLKILTIIVTFSIFGLIYTKNVILAICSYVLFKVILGIYEPIQQTYINSIIKGEYRATILSFYSMIGAIGEIFSGILIGIAAEMMGIRISFLISLIGFIFIIILFIIVQKLEKQHSITISH